MDDKGGWEEIIDLYQNSFHLSSQKNLLTFFASHHLNFPANISLLVFTIKGWLFHFYARAEDEISCNNTNDLSMCYRNRVTRALSSADMVFF